MATFSEINRAIEVAGVSPYIVLQSAGIHRSQWLRWKHGKFEPRQASVRAIKEALCRLEAA